MNASFRAKPEPPFEIPPRSKYNIVCTLRVMKPGEFSGQIHCYLGDPYLREILLMVSGTVREAKQ